LMPIVYNCRNEDSTKFPSAGI